MPLQNATEVRTCCDLQAPVSSCLLFAQQGPISVAVYIKNESEDLKVITAAIRDNSYVRRYVDFHLLFRFESGKSLLTYCFCSFPFHCHIIFIDCLSLAADEFYPVNTLRNFGTKHARTLLGNRIFFRW